jgi:hypothetical protein
VFYHLLNFENTVSNVSRKSVRLRHLVKSMFELCQAHLELDADGHQRLYFREALADFNQMHAKITEWLYQEFLRQIFGKREYMSCIFFIERISLKNFKDKNPNKSIEDQGNAETTER